VFDGMLKTSFSFLLSVNPGSTAYEATFLAPSEGGAHDIEVKILDHYNDILQNITAKEALEVQKPETKLRNVLKIAKSQFINVEKPLALAILALLILVTLALRKIVRFS